MKASMTKTEIYKQAARLGAHVEISNPGDGRTRFEFCSMDENGRLGRVIGYCSGLREAEIWLRGFEEGLGLEERNRRILAAKDGN